VDSGCTITWCGISPQGCTFVRLNSGMDMDTSLVLIQDTLTTYYETFTHGKVLHKNESQAEARDVGIMWQSSNSWLECTCCLGIVGINTGATGRPGIRHLTYQPATRCTMTYNIETLVLSNGGFPTCTAQTLCAIVYCSYRYTSSYATVATNRCGNIYKSSTDLMDAMLCDMMAHIPV